MNNRTQRIGWMVTAALALVALSALGGSVVINEVAWSGTAANASDEWIELHNPTDGAIDLTDWTLTFGEAVIHLGRVEGATVEVRRTSIAAGGYYILERTDDETVSDVEADALYKGSLPNTGTALVLRDGRGATIDRVDPSEDGWPAGTAVDGEPRYASMERVDPLGEVANWRSNDGVTRNGADTNGDPLNGTPGKENSARVIARRAPRVERHAPVAGAVVSGTTIVEWTATDPDDPAEALRILIELSFDGGTTWEILAANLSNGGSYAWDTTLHPDSEEVRLKVTAEDPEGHRGASESEPVTIRNEGE